MKIAVTVSLHLYSLTGLFLLFRIATYDCFRHTFNGWLVDRLIYRVRSRKNWPKITTGLTEKRMSNERCDKNLRVRGLNTVGTCSQRCEGFRSWWIVSIKWKITWVIDVEIQQHKKDKQWSANRRKYTRNWLRQLWPKFSCHTTTESSKQTESTNFWKRWKDSAT